MLAPVLWVKMLARLVLSVGVFPAYCRILKLTVLGPGKLNLTTFSLTWWEAPMTKMASLLTNPHVPEAKRGRKVGLSPIVLIRYKSRTSITQTIPSFFLSRAS